MIPPLMTRLLESQEKFERIINLCTRAIMEMDQNISPNDTIREIRELIHAIDSTIGDVECA